MDNKPSPIANWLFFLTITGLLIYFAPAIILFLSSIGILVSLARGFRLIDSMSDEFWLPLIFALLAFGVTSAAMKTGYTYDFETFGSE